MAKKVRLDLLLLQRGLVDTIEEAKPMIMAGLAYVNGQKLDKAGMMVVVDAAIELRKPLPYVSRGGIKLEAALQHFSLPIDNIVALDVGSSTGGFTDCLLQHGANKVFANDVGQNQLHYRLQQDSRVISYERIHIRDLTIQHVPDPVDAVVIDTSFISLKRVLPHAWTFLREGGWCVALIKPQFEVHPSNLRKGVVRDDDVRQQVVEDMIAWLPVLPQVHVVGVKESPIHGPKGNIEYLLVLERLK